MVTYYNEIGELTFNWVDFSLVIDMLFWKIISKSIYKIDQWFTQSRLFGIWVVVIKFLSKVAQIVGDFGQFWKMALFKKFLQIQLLEKSAYFWFLHLVTPPKPNLPNQIYCNDAKPDRVFDQHSTKNSLSLHSFILASFLRPFVWST